MIFLLYGSDTKKSLEKLGDMVHNAREKAGPDLDFHRFDAEEDDMGIIRQALEAQSLFSKKKLVVIKHLSESTGQERLYETLRGVRGVVSAMVVLWERELDAKKLGKLKPYCDKIQEFKSAPANVRAANPVFELGDTFFNSPRQGLRNLLGLLESGHDSFQTFSYLANHARTILTVKDAMDRRVEAHIPGVHPFVVKKASFIARSMGEKHIRSVFKNFFREDHKIKTGLAKPEESLVALLLEQEKK